MREIRKDAKTFKLNLVDGYRGRVHSPIVNLNSIPENKDGIRTVQIELSDGAHITVSQVNGNSYVVVNNHTNPEAKIVVNDSTKPEKSLTLTSKKMAFSDFEVEQVKVRTEKVQVTFKNFQQS